MDRALLVRRGEALLFCVVCWLPVVGACLKARVIARAVADLSVSAALRPLDTLVGISSALLGSLLR